jgi:hypothetical protein
MSNVSKPTAADNPPLPGIPESLQVQLRYCDDFIQMVILSEGMASRECIYMKEVKNGLHMHPDPQDGYSKCPIMKGGRVIFFRHLSEERLNELVGSFCEEVLEALQEEFPGKSVVLVDGFKEHARRLLRVLRSNEPLAEAMRQSDGQDFGLRKGLIDRAQEEIAGRAKESFGELPGVYARHEGNIIHAAIFKPDAVLLN